MLCTSFRYSTYCFTYLLSALVRECVTSSAALSEPDAFVIACNVLFQGFVLHGTPNKHRLLFSGMAHPTSNVALGIPDITRCSAVAARAALKVPVAVPLFLQLFE